MIRGKDAFEELKGTLSRLALEATDQEAYLTEMNFPVYELALEFEDSFMFLKQLVRERIINEMQTHAITAVYDELVAMNKRENDDIWNNEALYSALDWNKVRNLAKKALQLLPD